MDAVDQTMSEISEVVKTERFPVVISHLGSVVEVI